MENNWGRIVEFVDLESSEDLIKLHLSESCVRCRICYWHIAVAGAVIGRYVDKERTKNLGTSEGLPANGNRW